MFVAIDPGSHSTGVAIFRGETLERAFALAGGGEPLTMCGLVAGVVPIGAEVVIERPEEQRYRGTRPRVDDLILLSLTAGAIAGAMLGRAGSVAWLRPSEWKGQIPKPASVADPYIIASRVFRLISPDEAERIVLPQSRQAHWDVYDAIGIGLVALGRARRGLK